jgi:hypothetical protein
MLLIILLLLLSWKLHLKFTDGIAVIYGFASMEGSTPLTIISDFESIEESRGASIFEAL